MTQSKPVAHSTNTQSPADKPSSGYRGYAVLALGFRPFYLLAGAFGTLSVLLWAAQFSGWLGAAILHGPQWHAHEMLFGYTFAVIVGFLFTAVRNWTQQPTPAGAPLAALAALWLSGRVLALTPWSSWAALTDTVFTLGVAFGIARPLAASGNRRNYFFVVLVLALGIVNLAFYAALQDIAPFSADTAIAIGLDVVLFIMVVMAGRVVPMFTNNAVPGAGARRISTVEYTALGSILVLLAADLAGQTGFAAVIAAAAAIVHGVRLALWAPLKTHRQPLLWILHASYAWIVVYLALRAAAGLGWIIPNLAMHALTIGGIGGLTLGMMTRSALGHSGRPLAAGRAEIACFVLIQLSAAARVLLPIVVPAAYVAGAALSGLLWSVAFAIFTVAYWPVLTRPRIDGMPG
jgi:uncharacterized protein involved in response to NO